MRKISLLAAAACMGGITLNAQASCGSAFCSINTHQEISGLNNEPGGRISLRYEFIDQDQLRSGNDKVAVGDIASHHDELRTINRNFIAGFDYTLSANWGISVQAPLVSRSHDHLHHHHGEVLPEEWNFTELGDLRVLGRYQFLTNQHGKHYAGIRAGLKLPTGDFEITNDEGDEAERSLPPGTGSTDLLLGAYYGSKPNDGKISWFSQGLYQVPVDEQDDYRPGPQFSLDLGLNYAITNRLHALLQLNTHIKGRDSGENAEREDSGGTFISLSPGLSYDINHDVQVYGFFQHPLYQYVNGVQLTADWSAVAGVSYHF